MRLNNWFHFEIATRKFWATTTKNDKRANRGAWFVLQCLRNQEKLYEYWMWEDLEKILRNTWATEKNRAVLIKIVKIIDTSPLSKMKREVLRKLWDFSFETKSDEEILNLL